MKLSNIGYLLKEGLRSIWANKLMTIASIGVLIACLCMVGASYLLAVNLNELVGSVEEQNESVVFVKDEAGDAEIDELEKTLRDFDAVASVEFVSSQQALEQQQELLGDLMEGIEDEDYLPSSFVIKLSDVSQMKQIVSEIEAIDSVEKVNAPQELADTVIQMQSIIYTVGMIIVAILMIVSLVIISNTIRLTVFSRRREINIMKFVGATNAFIRTPFIIEGMLIGIIAALCSFFAIWGGYEALINWIGVDSFNIFNTEAGAIVAFESVMTTLFVGFVGGGAVIGALGSILAIRKHLKV